MYKNQINHRNCKLDRYSPGSAKLTYETQFKAQTKIQSNVSCNTSFRISQVGKWRNLLHYKQTVGNYDNSGCPDSSILSVGSISHYMHLGRNTLTVKIIDSWSDVGNGSCSNESTCVVWNITMGSGRLTFRNYPLIKEI